MSLASYPAAALNDVPVRLKQNFRADIQGMRAVAVLAVVLYHAGVPFLSGGYVGVDVFFVISGFLITTHLLDSLDREGRIRFGNFYMKRARRILPAAFAVIVLSALAAVIWVPPLQLESVFKGAAASALYAPNILFAVEGTNYLAEDTPSVFQHFWSLGIEEQFYLIWPAVLAGGFILCRRSKRGLFWLTAALTAASLLLCVVLTLRSQPWAFFSLPTRAWELGFGALTAFLLLRRPAWVQRDWTPLLGWAGLAALLAAVVTFDSATLFPSYNAVLPVLGTALLIIGGSDQGRLGAARALSLPPLQFIGLISYSLYLVHWPLLVIPQAAVGASNPLPFTVTLALGLVSIPLAYLLYRFVETPFRSAGPIVGRTTRRTGLIIGVSSATVVALALGGLYISERTPLHSGQQAVEFTTSEHPSGTPFVPSNLEPDLRAAAKDNPITYGNGCHLDYRSTDASGCLYGSDPSAPRVMLFGDSHAAQWFPALQVMADRGDILIDTNTKSACASVQVERLWEGAPYPECKIWRDGVLSRMADDPPAAVVVANYGAGDLAGGNGNFARDWREGLEMTLGAIPEETAAILIADTPQMVQTPGICLSANLEDSMSCNESAVRALNEELREVERTAALSANAVHIDLTDYLCGPEVCPAIIDNVLVYRDDNHITATISRAFSDMVAPIINQNLKH